MKIIFHPDAEAEVAEAMAYYEMRSPGLGADLVAEVEEALNRIRAFPDACPLSRLLE